MREQSIDAAGLESASLSVRSARAAQLRAERAEAAAQDSSLAGARRDNGRSSNGHKDDGRGVDRPGADGRAVDGRGVDGRAVDGTDEAGQSGAGDRLRAAREAAGLTRREVAARMHLDQRTLGALERDDYDALPAPTFVRGYLRTYAKLVSLQPAPIIAAYDNRGFAPPPLVADIGEKPQASSADAPMILFTAAIVVGLVTMVVLWWQNQRADLPPFSLPGVSESLVGGTDGGTGGQGTDAAASTADLLAARDPTGFQAGSAAAGSLDSSGARVSEQADAGEDPAAIVPVARGDSTSEPADDAVEPVAVTPPAAASAPAPSPVAVAAPGADTAAAASTEPAIPAAGIAAIGSDGELTMRFAEESWVEVYDRKGERLYWNLARAGAEVKVKGQPPINVVLGKANGAQVLFNGKRFDLAPHNNGGVARFQLGGTGASN